MSNSSKSLHISQRPETLAGIYGNHTTKTILESLLKKKELPHAILFHGPSGCGKTTLARIVASELKCSKMDFVEINAGDYRGIDTVRSIIFHISHKPLDGKTSVFILDEAHMLSTDAQNALLKPLEDTPDYVYFILCTTKPEKLIKTVRNRCHSFGVESLNIKEMEAFLKNTIKELALPLDNINELIEQIVRVSEGSPRTALITLDKTIHAIEEGDSFEIQSLVEEEIECIELCRALLKDVGWDKIRNILKTLERGEAERTRRAILGYMCSVLLNTRKAKDPTAVRADTIIEVFEDNYYDTGFSGLVHQCYLASSTH